MAKSISVKYRGQEKAQVYAAKKSATIKAENAEAVDIFARRSDVAAMEQSGNDLVVRFSDGSVTTLQGYFNCIAGSEPTLAIVDGTDQQIANVSFEDGVCGAQGATSHALAYSLTPAGAGQASAFLPVAAGLGAGPLLGLGAAAVGGAVAAAGGSDSGDGGDVAAPGDQLAPAAPTIRASNGVTITGTAEPRSKVSLDISGDGSTDVTVDVGASGEWTFTPTNPVSNGTTITARAVDASGNTSGPTTSIVDALSAVPVIGGIVDDVGAITGTIASGNVTDDRRPVIAGTGADANATVTVLDGNTQIGTTVADASGNWTFRPAIDLEDGAHTFTAQATDSIGNTSAPSAPYLITIDTSTPSAPVFTATDGTQVSGSAEPGSTVILDLDGDGSADATVQVNGAGSWSFTPPERLPEGTVVSGRAQDAAGNISEPAATIVGADAEEPELPNVFTLVSVTDDIGTIIGSIANGGVTDDTRPTVQGSGVAANSIVDLFDGTLLVGTTTSDARGDWSITPGTPLAQGPHSFSARIADSQGNSRYSNVYALSIDTTPPAAPVINPTNGAAVTGTAEPGSTVRLDLNGDTAVDVEVPANSNGGWSYTPSSPLQEGTTITARAVDLAGNTSVPASATVDADASPTPPVIGAVTDDVGAVTGLVQQGSGTDDTLPTISGSGVASGATVTIFDGAVQLGTATASPAGAWTFTPTVALTPGSHSFTATATSTGGVVGPASSAYTINVVTSDTTPPAAPRIDGVSDDVGPVTGSVPDNGNTDDTIPTLSGSGAEPNAAVVVFDGGTRLGTTTANGSGNWVFTPLTPLAPGAHSFTASAIDASGNQGPASTAYDVTVVRGAITPPPSPTITGLADDVGPTVGNVPAGGTTDDALPTLSGRAEAGTTVAIFDGPAQLGTAVAGAEGGWSFTPPSPLGTGTHAFSARSVDASGGMSEPSSSYTVTIASNPAPVPPSAVVEITTITKDTGVVGDWRTEDMTPRVSGTLSQTLASGEAVEVRVDSGAWQSAAVTGASWSYQFGALPAGSHSIEARVVSSNSAVGDVDSQSISILPQGSGGGSNDDPIVQARDADLLGIISADVIDLVDFNDQALTAVDPDNDLVEVEVSFAPLLNVNLNAYTLTASAALAASLGLEIDIDNDPGLLGLLAPSSVLTITAIDGGTIDNVAINQLLETVRYEQDITLVGAQVSWPPK